MTKAKTIFVEIAVELLRKRMAEAAAGIDPLPPLEETVRRIREGFTGEQRDRLLRLTCNLYGVESIP